MCTINILIIVTEIVRDLARLMRINFIANDTVIDNQLAALPLSDKIQIKSPLDSNPKQSRREAQVHAQKIFLSICDLINLKFDTEKDEHAVHKASSAYIDLLSQTVLSIPDFIKVQIDSNTESIYQSAINRADILGWNAIKNSLIACWTLIFCNNAQPEDKLMAADSKDNLYMYKVNPESGWDVTNNAENIFNQ